MFPLKLPELSHPEVRRLAKGTTSTEAVMLAKLEAADSEAIGVRRVVKVAEMRDPTVRFDLNT